ncbi:MAG: homoaconitate hydratase, partial [Gaiellaceae bacterium]
MSVPPDKLFLGDLNARALGERPRRHVGLYDTTLRDGEQAVGVALDPEQKLEIARLLDALGIDRIEAGFPRVSADDANAIRLVADAGLKAEIWGFSRAVPADVEALIELGLRHSVIEAPVSDLKLAAYGVEPDVMLERIRKAVAFAVEHDITVAYFGVDGTRADLSFLERVYTTAVEAGAREAVVVDTLGVATPEAAAFLVEQVASWVDVP